MDDLIVAVRKFLSENPDGVSKRQLRDGVGAAAPAVEAAFATLVANGEAAFEPPARQGMAGRCSIVANEDEENDADSWRPARKCPKCGRYPNVRFTGVEVRSARMRRQAALVQSIRCRCGAHYWIRNRDIAKSELDAQRKVA